MVLAPRPPIDPDYVDTLNLKNIQQITSKFNMRVDTPWATLLRSQTTLCFPQIFKMQYLHKFIYR